MNAPGQRPTFVETVKLLLATARRRARARGKHQQKLMNSRRSGKEGIDWGCLGFVLFLGMCGMLNGMFVWLAHEVVDASAQVAAEAQGKIVLQEWHYDTVKEESAKRAKAEEDLRRLRPRLDFIKGQIKAGGQTDLGLSKEAKLREIEVAKAERDKGYAEDRVKQMLGFHASDYRHQGDEAFKERELARVTEHYHKHGVDGFVSDKEIVGDLRVSRAPLVALMLSLIIVWWSVMLAFQGEGLEMDLSRRRHPMWEWLASHPVSQRAVFAAEMLSPLAANPFFLAAPCFWIGMFWWVYADAGVGILAGVLAGLPLGIAACCVGKALEIACLLRLAPRSRGAVIGIMSWLGYASFVIAMISMGNQGWVLGLMRWIGPWLDGVQLPMFDWMLGLAWGGAAWWKGVLVCWFVAAVAATFAIIFSARATQRGLAGAFGSVVSAPVVLGAERSRRWLSDPLYRKELLWFWRDRGALVQVFLIPITMAATQSMNLRNLASLAGRSWHTVCGAAVIFGTYFLFILGPRSLVSEGQALWLPMTWPRGMESLLKAKARLWWMLATGIVFVLLAMTMAIYRDHWWQIIAVGVGWFMFSGSLAEKSVTLVNAPSSSGEPEPVPAGRRWAAQIGTLTFAIGVLSQNWSLAFVGIVYSWLTAAAMWQNFRARLPFLFDPWSEKVPPPPTLMHSMIAISGMMELMTIIFVGMVALLGKDQIIVARSVAYGIAGFVIAVVMHGWLSGRDVSNADIWNWRREEGDDRKPRSLGVTMLAGLGLGAALGIVGLGYVWLVQQVPALRDALMKSEELIAAHPDQRWWLAVMAIGIAPLAEEYLFRGLLYRALDREWGGWRAMAGSALFFAIYHPPVSWIPVAAVGFLNAYLFHRTRHLAPCVAVHMAYNAVVVLAS